ncbi:NosD domain-containing protein [Halorubrum sp. DTA98]|uniref:NosD domain-containing protein n=1 Tax=Halorubrum sp. DTA98 TaxID=3402163 RepID=UPI003AAE6E81
MPRRRTRYVVIFGPSDDRSRHVLLALAVLLVLAVIVTAGAFLTDPGAAAPSPVAYNDAVELGVSSETDELMTGSATVPRIQVFYSQLQYVVGYNGIESFVGTIDDGRTDGQFGYPLAAYVETFDDADPGSTADGLFSAQGAPSWTSATDAVYVVDSDVRTPAGKTVVPFAEREAAGAFADVHGGTIIDWTTLRTLSFDVDTAVSVRSMAPDRWERADERIATAEVDTDRPVSVVVGADEPTIGAAVAAAPPNTTVLVPPGRYEETVEVTKPISLVGENAHLHGGGEGSVVTVRAPNVAIVGVTVTGTGGETRNADAAEGPPDADEAWDTNVQLGYGHGDAAIRAVGAPGLFVDGVDVDTNASGVLLRDGSDAVIRDLHVEGPDDWRDGFMGVIAMESRVTLTNATVSGGRDGVYLHRADGSVVRNATFVGNRYGLHLMYTGDALLADNVVRDAEFGGITVMTRPSGNAIVGNDVRDSSAGIQASGTRSYVGYNTLANNRLGFSTSARGSLYEHNVLVDNEEGARATTVVPSSRIVANDFVGNDRHAGAGAGALRIWADGERGNYWEGAAVGVHEPGERAYRPTSPVDAALHREVAAVAVRESPATALLHRLQGTVPGARSGAIIDPSPATGPHAPDRIAAARGADTARADWRMELDRPMTIHETGRITSETTAGSTSGTTAGSTSGTDGWGG